MESLNHYLCNHRNSYGGYWRTYVLVITLLVIRLFVITLFATFVHKTRLDLWRANLLYSE